MGGNKNSSKKETFSNDERFGFDVSDDEEEVPNRNQANDRFERLP